MVNIHLLSALCDRLDEMLPEILVNDVGVTTIFYHSSQVLPQIRIAGLHRNLRGWVQGLPNIIRIRAGGNEQPDSRDLLHSSQERQEMFPPHCLVTFVESINSNEDLIEVLANMQQRELEILCLGLSILLPELRIELN